MATPEPLSIPTSNDSDAVKRAGTVLSAVTLPNLLINKRKITS